MCTADLITLIVCRLLWIVWLTNLNWLDFDCMNIYEMACRNFVFSNVLLFHLLTHAVIIRVVLHHSCQLRSNSDKRTWSIEGIKNHEYMDSGYSVIILLFIRHQLLLTAKSPCWKALAFINPNRDALFIFHFSLLHWPFQELWRFLDFKVWSKN